MLWSGRHSVAALVPHNKKVPRSNPPVYTFSLWVPKAVTVTGAMSVNVSMYGCLSMETCPGCALSLALNGKWDRLRPPLYHSCTLKIQFVSSHFYTSVDFTQLNFVYVITVGRYSSEWDCESAAAIKLFVRGKVWFFLGHILSLAGIMLAYKKLLLLFRREGHLSNLRPISYWGNTGIK